MTTLFHTATALFFMLWCSVANAQATAADFTLRSIEGESVSLSDHVGKVVIVSFWATWCGPCKEEMPHLQRLYTTYQGQGLEVISISTDDARMAAQVKPYIKKNGYSFTVLLDKDASVISSYNPSKTLPFTVVVDRDGKVAKVHAGFNPGDELKLESLVTELLGRNAKSAAVPADSPAKTPIESATK